MISWNFHCFYLLVAKRYFRDLQISKNGKFRQFSKIFTFVVWPTYFLTGTYFDSSTVHTERHKSVKSSVHCWLLLAVQRVRSETKTEESQITKRQSLDQGLEKNKNKKRQRLDQWSMAKGSRFLFLTMGRFFAAVFSIFADTHQPTVLWWQQIADNRINSS